MTRSMLFVGIAVVLGAPGMAARAQEPRPEEIMDRAIPTHGDAGNFISNGQDGSGNDYAQGDTFTPSATSTFTSLEIALSNLTSTNTDELQVSLTRDSGLSSPGSVITSFNVAPGTLGLFGNNNAPLSFGAPSGITLAAGTPYWVTAADIGGGTVSNVWNWNGTGDVADHAVSNDGGTTWFSLSGMTPEAFQVDGTSAVPGPTSPHLLFGIVIVGLIGSRRRRLRLRPRRSAKSRPETESLEPRLVLSTSFTWTWVSAPSPPETGTMLQMPNGNLMMVGEYALINGNLWDNIGGASNYWEMIQPDSTGNYANSSYPSSSLMSTPRLDFGTNVLPSGNIFLLGGEYSGNDGHQTETNTGEMYNASTNTWGPVANFPQPTFGDNETILLNDGLILTGTGAEQGLPYTVSGLTYLYNPTSSSINAMVNGSSQSIAPGTYSSGIPTFDDESNSEENWVKLPDGDVVSYLLWVNDYFLPGENGYAELFNPAIGEWQDISPADGTAKGSIPPLSAAQDVNGEPWFEMGPSLLLPNGDAFFVSGGTSNTALYNPSTNTWFAGPSMPYPFTADEAPAAELPNGDVIFAADWALELGQHYGPTVLLDYTPSSNPNDPGTMTQLFGSNSPNDPGIGSPAVGSFPFRMLVLPTGQLMLADAASGELWLGTPSGGPQPQWRPVVQGFSGSNGLYTLTGIKLNGMDAGAAYGDDAGMDENYPIARFVNGSGTVYYGTTSNWSLTGVQTGNATETVTVTLPAGMPSGNYSLIVSGAGISSFPVAVHVTNAVVPGSSTSKSLNVLPAGTTATLLPVLAPKVAPFGSASVGVAPPSASAALGTTPSFADAVDAVFAGGELGWIDSAAFGGKQQTWRVRGPSPVNQLGG